jgi:hypothetical protein
MLFRKEEISWLGFPMASLSPSRVLKLAGRAKRMLESGRIGLVSLIESGMRCKSKTEHWVQRFSMFGVFRVNRTTVILGNEMPSARETEQRRRSC